jgi:hypothetical protein
VGHPGQQGLESLGRLGRHGLSGLLGVCEQGLGQGAQGVCRIHEHGA